MLTSSRATKDRIFEQIDFHKLFTLNYWQRQWEHKQITALLRSYRLFQAFSYLQCPFLTLALCEWFGANKNNWRQFSSTSTKEKQWHSAWPRVRWQLWREVYRHQKLKMNLTKIKYIPVLTKNSHENDKTGDNSLRVNTSWNHVGVTNSTELTCDMTTTPGCAWSINRVQIYIYIYIYMDSLFCFNL